MQYQSQFLFACFAFGSAILVFRWFGTSLTLWRVSFSIIRINSTHHLSVNVSTTILATTTTSTVTTATPQARMKFNISARHYTKDISQCWTDEDYVHWKQGDFYPLSSSYGKIAFMVLTGNDNLRSRCDIIMCTLGVTVHPSRLFFVGESSTDRRIPIYDVVHPRTPRPVNRRWSNQKVNRGLAAVIKMLNESKQGAEVEWLMVMDDDTFVSPKNLELLLSDYNSTEPLMIGQAHDGRFFGGAGYVFSRALFQKLPPFIISCHRTPQDPYSDVTVPRCITAKTGVKPIDRKEFNSQPPLFYTNGQGIDDRPQGYGRAVSFHYITPAEKYLSLWRLQEAFLK